MCTSQWYLSKTHTRPCVRHTERHCPCGLRTRRNDRNPPRNLVKCYLNIFSDRRDGSSRGLPIGFRVYATVAARYTSRMPQSCRFTYVPGQRKQPYINNENDRPNLNRSISSGRDVLHLCMPLDKSPVCPSPAD